MIASLKNVFKIEELRTKIFYTFFLLFVYRLVAHVPTPGIDFTALSEYFTASAAKGQGILGLLDVFAGGALRRATVLALGIMPYISASIILQLLTAVVPALEKLAKRTGTKEDQPVHKVSDRPYNAVSVSGIGQMA